MTFGGWGVCLSPREEERWDFWSTAEEEREVTDQKPQSGRVARSGGLHAAAEVTGTRFFTPR